MPVTRDNVEAAMNEASRFLERAQYYLDHSSRSGFCCNRSGTSSMMRSGSDLTAALVKLRRSERDQKWLDERKPYNEED